MYTTILIYLPSTPPTVVSFRGKLARESAGGPDDATATLRAGGVWML